jgi:hypothetical protein
MRTDWTTVGKEYSETDELKARIREAVAAMEWHDLRGTGELSVPMMPGLGIKEAIKQLRIPKVWRVAWSNELAPSGFYGISGRYKNADVDVYLVDEGTHLTPVCMDVEEKAVLAPCPA